MSVIEGLICRQENGSLSFGNNEALTKQKLKDFDICGDLYNVKTFKEITKLEKNGKLLFESVPGSVVTDFIINNDMAEFYIEALEDLQVTLELEADKEYKIFIDSVQVGRDKTNLSGKVSIGIDFEGQRKKHVLIEKIN